MTTKKRILQIVLLSFVVLSVVYAFTKEKSPLTNQAPQAEATETKVKAHRIIAYYFHGNARCTSCLKIENYSSETIKSKFSDQLKNGTLEWKVINVEEAAHQHFIQDYQLYTKSLVLVEMRDGQRIKWKNLEKVWEHLGDPKQFATYVETELKTYLSSVSGT